MVKHTHTLKTHVHTVVVGKWRTSIHKKHQSTGIHTHTVIKLLLK